MTYTLISGATGGLGRAFCEACAKRGENLFITARDGEKLRLLAHELYEKYAVTVKYAPCLLQDELSRTLLFSQIREAGAISRLVNVAGADIQKAFTEYTQEKAVFQTRVNFEAAVALTKFALENRAPRLEIITISSVSGIYPMPYFALYSATKAALTQFFTALRLELKGQGVKVTTVLPGAMPTREDIKEQIKGQGLWGKLAAKPVEYVAEKALKAVEKNKAKLIPGFWNKVMAIVTKPIPMSVKTAFIARRWSKIEKDAF
ncbi:MAG: SDR family NAD(P)-dependent oxidoreductase [Clostridia bacterium]|nr:SDR family NAD(P)-dependent oxidoreductase [Clostridia bacterium]